MIQIRNLNKKYGELQIFENASIALEDKGFVCILGPSGCGKSTFFNLLAGFDRNYAGEINIHGSVLGGWDADRLCAYRRDNVGFVFQDYHLLSGYTVMENILLATDMAGIKRADGERRARELLESLGLSEKAGQKAQSLSGGQKQRVAIARALVNRPSILMADEPTGALDRNNSMEIMELLQELSGDCLVLMITHDKKCAEYAEHTLFIRDGKFVTDQGIVGIHNETLLQHKKQGHVPLFHRAVKNFRAHLSRYMAISAVIAIGVFCFMMSLSSKNIMEKSIDDFQAKNTALHNGYIKTTADDTEVLALLEKDGRIEDAYVQYVLKDVSLTAGNHTETMAEKYPMPKATEEMSYGVMPENGKNEIGLSPSLAAKFNQNIKELVGKEVEVTYDGQKYSFTVSGIFNASYDDFFVSSDVEQQMYRDGSEDDAYSVSYDVKLFDDIVPVSDYLKEQGLESQNAEASVAAFLSTFQSLNRLFRAVSLLIFGIGVFISAVLLLRQQNTRFREIGLLSALGYTRRSLRRMLLAENLLISADAALCNGILVIAALLVRKICGFQFALTVQQVLLSVILTAVIIFAISIPASIRLVCIDPAQALRK